MSIIDFLLLAVILAGIIIGARSGIIHQIASIVAIIVAIIITRIYGTDATSMLLELMPDMAKAGNTICSITGHILLFIIVYVIIRLLGGAFRKLFHGMKLGPVDRLCGAVFCVIKYCLVLSIVLNIILLISPNTSIVRGSKLFGGSVCKAVVNFAPWLIYSDFVPWSINAVNGDA